MRIGVWAAPGAVHGVALDPQLPGSIEQTVRAGPDLEAGIRAVLTELAGRVSGVSAVGFGMDTLLRAALARNTVDDTTSVALLRIRPRPTSVAAFGRIAVRGLDRAVRHQDYVAGGHDMFGIQVAELDLPAVGRAAERWMFDGVRAVAIAATGSVANPDHERRVAEYLAAEYPELAVWLSHESGGPGLLDREALTVMQTLLADDGERIADWLERTTRAVGIDTGCHLLTSDGGRITTERMRSVPLAALGSDCAALLLGAASDADRTDLTVLAVDGRTVRVGRVVDGLPEVPAELPMTAHMTIAELSTWDVILPVTELQERRGAWSEALVGAHVAVVDEGADPADVREVETFARACQPTEVSLQHNAGRLRAIAVATCEPVVRVDRLVAVSTEAQMRAAIDASADRAFSLLAASGGTPGTERVTRVRATALKYMQGDNYRIHVRAAGRSLVELDRGGEPDRAATRDRLGDRAGGGR